MKVLTRGSIDRSGRRYTKPGTDLGVREIVPALRPLFAGLVVVATSLGAQTPPPPAPAPAVPATAATRTDTAAPRREKKPRIPLTPALEASAFASPEARRLLLQARDQRMRQDSSIAAYDATTYSRVTVGLGVRSIGRERLAMRSETSARVRWQRGTGAYLDLTGSRSAVPMAAGADADVDLDLPSLPYYPGRDALWFGGSVARADVEPDEIIHPLANGAEAYYRYAAGDSLTLDIGGGRRIVLRELRVTARVPEWRRIVGSFWFDVANGQLVRAAYRFSTEMDIRSVAEEEDPTAFEDVPTWVKPMIFPMRASLEGVAVEYGLFNGVWLPRTQSLTASAQVSMMRLPVTFEERYQYASVNVRDTTLAPIVVPGNASQGGGVSVGVSVGGKGSANDSEEDEDPDGAARTAIARGIRALGADSLRARLALVPSGDSLRRAAREARSAGDTATYRRLRRAAADAQRDSGLLDRQLQCVTTGFRTRQRVMYDNAVPVISRVPCDRAALAKSPDLPPSLFSPGEALFGVAEREALLAELGFGLQAGVAPQRPKVDFSYADGAIRYNRVEGLSAGVGVSQELGGGWRWRGDARFGIGDRQPLASVSGTRTSGRRSVTARLYRETALANDLGQPLAFGASLASLLYAHDDGLYYRAAGADITWRTEPDGATSARLFAERHADAPVTSRWSLFGGSNDATFAANVVARRGTWMGADLRDRRTLGLDPDDWRLFTDVRLEGATGTSDYARLFAEGTVTRTIVGPFAGAITASAGTTAGTPPAQRQFFLGGLQTVRGQFVSPVAPGFAGTSFWFARHELAWGRTAGRASLFYDVGWAGDRAAFGARATRPMQGVGVGVSALDGLVRLDVARGLAPVRQTRVDLSIDVRF